MKTTFGITIGLVALFVCSERLLGGNSDLDIHVVPKKVDENVKKASDGGANTVKEHWTYEVTVENRTFKELANLEVKYVIFFKREKLGSKDGPTAQQQSGIYKVASIQSHRKTSFSTDNVELKKANLVGAWHYSSGAKPNAQDTLVGIAVRVFQNGQQFAEYANPPNLAKEKVE